MTPGQGMYTGLHGFPKGHTNLGTSSPSMHSRTLNR